MCRVEHPLQPSGGKVGLYDLVILLLFAISAGNFMDALSI